MKAALVYLSQRGVSSMKTLLISIIGLITLASLAFAGEGAQRQITGHAYTSNGFVKQGCYVIWFYCGSGATCTINGATLVASSGITLPSPWNGYYGDIPYTVSGGTLTTLEVR